MNGLVILESTDFDEDGQSTVGATPLMSINSCEDSELSERRTSSEGCSTVKDTCTLHVQKFKANLLLQLPVTPKPRPGM